MENDVFVLILGTTEGAYALAHAFFHDYGIRPTVMDVDAPFYIKESASLRYERVPGMEDGRMLLLAAERFYERHSGKSLFLLPVKEEYAAITEAHRDRLETMFFMPRIHRGDADLRGACGLLFAYRGTEGDMRTAYGRVAAQDSDGHPTVFLAGRGRTIDMSAMREGSIALFAEDADGCFAPLREPLSAVLFFLTAADVSLPEYLVNDYVLCEALPEEEWLSGMFSLYPYRWMKKQVFPHLRGDADRRAARRMATALFSPAREKGFRFRLRLARFAKNCAQRPRG
jgi:hypothetical protein